MTTLRLIHGAAALVAAGSLAVTLWTGLHDQGVALAFGVLIAVGELTRWSDEQGQRQAAPLGAAGALSYALLGADAGRPGQHGAAQVVTVVLVATVLGAVPHIWSGRSPTVDHLTRRILTVGFAAVCFQPLYGQGVFAHWGGPAYALLLLTLLALTSLCGAVLAAALAHCRTHWPFGPLLREELRGLLGIGSAICSTGAVMALAVAVVGLWALPVFCLPMLLVQLSLRRYAAVRATYRQTIASLARATEIAGCTPAGHAHRVAALSLAVGRDLGLTGPELTVLEYAALMHDIGQLSLVDPVPAGATAGLPAAEQRRIALLGGAVVRQTGVDAAVAVVVERQADPYREQPLAARIVRAVNAYEEKTRDAGPEGPLRALEELRLGTAGDYAPEVVESLARVLARPPGVRERVPVRRTGLSDPAPGWVTHG
ncbi:metal-dependent phosphohydrolase [Streptomyces sp. MC1]|uniref:HD-GYP domain-containing protein n=1 Tax=Streptomyces TaxID=1883 RepID=UPI0004CA9612|nr:MULTISPECIES: metal-dependent phosphohydrolase [Streptomyces]KOG63261.1 metal-dependent phosphohydrolase [Streptomyces antibioticus]KOV73059.1 metal-dependent phosphohydrolase [Streptomyces sp. NRRL WC-3723]MBG7700082.1 metal-dependent phosphohydrolase [Streptomyces sp. MC1]